MPLLIVAGVVAGLGFVAALAIYVTLPRTPPAPAASRGTTATAPDRPAAPVEPAPSPPTPAPPETSELVRYTLRSLLGIDTRVDVDATSAHLRGLFPSISSERVADELRFTVPLDHAWFGEAELRWKNERAGKLTTVGFRPPRGETKLKNQKQIADCLVGGLGKPEVREVDHLAGEVSYFWGRNFPKAWANLYSGYLWLSFEDPRGVPPVTFAQVVRTLAGCTP